MAKKPPAQPPVNDESTTPREYPQTLPPRDLYPTSDIRFVMVEVGKLCANVERLIADVKSHGEKLDGIKTQSTYIKGAIAASVLLIGLFITAATWVINRP